MTHDRLRRLTKYPLALAAVLLIAACSSPKIDNPLYNTLYAILEEHQKLWELPESQGGGKNTEVSEEICPLVTFRNLDRMYSDIRDTNIVGKTYIANGMGLHPNKSYQYFIRKKVNFITTSFLYIVMNENGYCNAQYRQYNF